VGYQWRIDFQLLGHLLEAETAINALASTGTEATLTRAQLVSVHHAAGRLPSHGASAAISLAVAIAGACREVAREQIRGLLRRLRRQIMRSGEPLQWLGRGFHRHSRAPWSNLSARRQERIEAISSTNPSA
jgi:hypothetical protein